MLQKKYLMLLIYLRRGVMNQWFIYLFNVWTGLFKWTIKLTDCLKTFPAHTKKRDRVCYHCRLPLFIITSCYGKATLFWEATSKLMQTVGRLYRHFKSLYFELLVSPFNIRSKEASHPEQINIGFRYRYARLNSQWSQQAVDLEYLFLIVCHYTKLDILVCDEAGRGRVHMSSLHIVQSHCPLDCLAPDLRNPNYMSAKTTYNTRPTRQLITWGSPCTFFHPHCFAMSCVRSEGNLLCAYIL